MMNQQLDEDCKLKNKNMDKIKQIWIDNSIVGISHNTGAWSKQTITVYEYTLWTKKLSDQVQHKEVQTIDSGMWF